MDQGGELFHNPKVCKIFKKWGFKINPNGADASHKNGPVNHAHWSVSKGIQVLWPCTFQHYLCLQNSYPSWNQVDSPIFFAFNCYDNFQHLTTFSCCVWDRPTWPHYHQTKGKLDLERKKIYSDWSKPKIPLRNRIKISFLIRYNGWPAKIKKK